MVIAPIWQPGDLARWRSYADNSYLRDAGEDEAEITVGGRRYPVAKGELKLA